MKTELAKKLIEKGIIREDTQFEAYYNAHGLSCVSNARTLATFRTKSAKLSADKQHVILEACTGVDRTIYRFTEEDIIVLDGMAPEKLAKIFYISPNGEDIVRGTRRGRKTKLRLEEEALEEDDEEEEDME